MAIERIFLGTQRPALELVTDYLFGRFGRQTQADFREVVVVLPGGRAGRRLLERLVDEAQGRKVRFTPPRIITVGQLPELLYRPKKPFADDLVQQLVWVETLQATDPDTLRQVIAELPDSDDQQHWLVLGKLLQGLHRELASNALDFRDVATRCAVLAGDRGTRRWQRLAHLQNAYLARLDQLALWDRQTARRVAIARRECHSEQPIVLVGTVDMDGALRQMLDQVSDQVTALIYAAEDWADRFDRHGCVKPEAWQMVRLDLPDEQLLRADDSNDQAEAVVRRIAAYDRRWRAEQITIGLPDEQLVLPLTRQLDQAGVPNRFGPGRSLASSPVYRLLADLAAWLETGHYEAFAALVRHPDVESWLHSHGAPPGWIELLDAYYNRHLPVKISNRWLGEDAKSQPLRVIGERVVQLTAGLTGGRKPLDHYLAAVGQVLVEIYGQRTFDLQKDADQTVWKTCRAVQDALEPMLRVPRSVMPATTPAEALRLVLNRMRGVRVAPASRVASIELVGWLELPLDDAPALVVASFNEPFVPASINADLFLPDRLRSTLGLDDNRRRYARDAYAVTTLLAPWRDTTWIVANHNSDGDPLVPSRLLFAERPETVARRATRFFSSIETPAAQRPLAGSLTAPLDQFAFQVPRPRPLTQPIDSMSVTSFADYLACPYRFYLTRVLRLASENDQAKELDGAAFGNLAHYVLEQFGRSDRRDSTDADKINKVLSDFLDWRVRHLYGSHPAAAVRIQIEQLRLRLAALARWQAGRRADGWRIEYTELSFADRPGEIVVDGQPMRLTGRIDRIDLKEGTEQRQILDYKTSDRGDPPEKTHRKRSREWVNLQLPLYRHLASKLEIDGPVGLGYILLPKKAADVGLAEANWTDADLAAADKATCRVVRKIRKQEFWPPAEPPPAYSEELAAICLDGVFGK